MAETKKPDAAPGAASPPAPPDPPADPAVVFEPSPVLEAEVDKELTMAALKCPHCGGETKAYEGPNPHKAGSYECPRCQVRVRPQ